MQENKTFYEKTLSTIFNFIAGGALIVDKQGRVVGMNSALQKMTGWRPEEVVGKKSCYILFGCRCQGASGKEICCSRIKLSPNPNDSYQQMSLVTSEGKMVRVWISFAPLPDMGSESPAAIVLVRYITEGIDH